MSAIYQEWRPYGSAREEGWGEPESAPDVAEYDEDDAEVMDCWIRQLPRLTRALFVRRFVQRLYVPRLDVDAALRALADLMEANWAAVDRMEGR